MSVHKLGILVEAMGAEQASRKLKGVDAAVSSIGGRAGKGLRTLGANLKSAFTTPLGLIGITGGLFGLEHIMSESIGKAQAFGSEVTRIASLTGVASQSAAGLALAFEHYGIEADQAIKVTAMLEKNVGLLTVKDTHAADGIAKLESKLHHHLTALQRAMLIYPKAGKFVHDFGLQLFNSNGRLKDANDLLLTSADYFNNKNIPATTKAAALAKLFGRSWADLIPLLSAGSDGLKKIQEEASKAGLGDLAKAVQDQKAAMRDWNTALNVLEITVGAKLLPKITDLARVATAFVGQHSDEIVGFFEDAAKFAGEMGGAIHDYVIPAISMIGDAWGKVPPDLKKLMIAGFAVNKLSGGALSGIVGDLAKGLIKGVLGINAGVANVTGGVVNVSGPGGGTPLPGSPVPAEPGGIVVPAVGAVAVLDMVQAQEEANKALNKINGTTGQQYNATKDLVARLSGTPLDVQVVGGSLTGRGGPGRGNVPASSGMAVHNKTERTDSLHTTKFVLSELGKMNVNLAALASIRNANLSGEGQMAGWAKPLETQIGGVVTATDLLKSSDSDGHRNTRVAVAAGSQNVAQATRSGTSGTTAATNVGSSRVVGAIQANRPIITNTIKINVSGTAVASSVTTTSRYGSPTGSAGSGSNGGRKVL